MSAHVPIGDWPPHGWIPAPALPQPDWAISKNVAVTDPVPGLIDEVRRLREALERRELMDEYRDLTRAFDRRRGVG